MAENKEIRLASSRECTGCMACIDACPKGALSFSLSEDGHEYISVDKTKCISCHLCERTCPSVSRMDYSNSEKESYFAAWASDVALRKSSASGGAFSAIASSVLDKGGVVFGAALEGVAEVRHVSIESKEDLQRLQGSKYTHSIAAGSYSSVLKFLQEGRMVLFSGTGCQVAGLYGFLASRKYSGKLVTVDLICGGVPSRNLIDKFIQNEPYQVKKIISFRTKDSGWKPKGFLYNLKVEDTDGNVHDYTGKKNLITDGFCSGLTNRYSCYDCKYVGTRRKSDFTVGDFWGVPSSVTAETFDGVSLVIAHNSAAEDFLKSAESFIHVKEVDKEIALAHNHRVFNGHSSKSRFLERKYLGYLFNHLSYKTLGRIYAYDFSKYSPWMLYKALRYLLTNIYKRI